MCVRCGAHILHFVFEESNLTVLRFVNGFSTQAITYYYIVFDRKSILVRNTRGGLLVKDKRVPGRGGEILSKWDCTYLDRYIIYLGRI